MDEQEFCKYCDQGPNGYGNCGEERRKPTPEKRKLILGRLVCGDSTIEGIRVWTREDGIEIHGVPGKKVTRDSGDIPRLRELIQNQKAAYRASGRTLPPAPETSPLVKALSQ